MTVNIVTENDIGDGLTTKGGKLVVNVDGKTTKVENGFLKAILPESTSQSNKAINDFISLEVTEGSVSYEGGRLSFNITYSLSLEGDEVKFTPFSGIVKIADFSDTNAVFFGGNSTIPESSSSIGRGYAYLVKDNALYLILSNVMFELLNEYEKQKTISLLSDELDSTQTPSGSWTYGVLEEYQKQGIRYVKNQQSEAFDFS